MYEQILYEVEDPIATITLNRPERLNAWTDRMGDELRHAVAAAETDPNVVAIVITGGGRGFCAGADLKGLEAISAGDRSREASTELAAEPGDATADLSFRGPYTFLMSVRKPVIAAINGPCAGMAVPIALCADLRFASDRAVFTTAFVQRGLIAEWGISWLLPRLVGTAHAMDLILSARKIDAAEAERIGLVNRVLPHDELLPHVRDYAVHLAENCSPTSMMVMKRQIYQDLTKSLEDAHEVAVSEMIASFDRPDFKEGVSSFLEKRKPGFERIRFE
ncbi:MAG: enoyl-CoA hydratase [Deltaproteobacteria bacterium]|nr:enoyl-CoA hydratase [Deltaproteobacteria bacterium]MBW2447264.1 enoyl-CoA hydratase [Deltaproteobacteria bacterium]